MSSNKKRIGSKAQIKGGSKKKQGKKGRADEQTHPLSSKVQFSNREIGWLNFNWRVLHEARDLRTPFMERFRYLSISSSNLDEFFMKRVGRLKRHLALGLMARSADGKLPQEQLIEIRANCLKMIAEKYRIFQDELVPGLKKLGVHVLKWSELNPSDLEWALQYYKRNVFPVLTPLSVDPGHPFPFISNLSISLGVSLRHPDKLKETDELVFARVKVPQVLPQWIELPSVNGDIRFLSIIELIKENLPALFPNMEVVKVMPFRLTRNADISRDEEDADDLLQLIEEELRMRRFAEVVRLEHGPNPDPWMLRLVCEELDLNPTDVYEVGTEIDLTRILNFVDLAFPKEKFPSFNGQTPVAFQSDDHNEIFAEIRRSDHLVHHPYDNFSTTVEKFVRLAAEDPKVLAIKMTLYRTGDKSPFIKSLIRAAEEGKQVVCLIELKARFDEERNIFWAQELENAGVHVVYGIIGHKTHAKATMVVRQDPDGLRTYAHLATGNYNTQTARFYTDLGLFTAEPEITSELSEFFNYLTGISLKTDYAKLLLAPINMFARFKEMIVREQEHAKAGRPSGIFAKMNNMEENDIGWALYDASEAGVPVDLLVRGFCSLRAGIPKLSASLKITSVLGRFLEHSRVFYFRNGKSDPVDGDFFIGSADWMYRNLHSRVECITPILSRKIREDLWSLMDLYKKDNRQTWEMNSDESYSQRKGEGPGIHEELMRLAIERTKSRSEESR